MPDQFKINNRITMDSLFYRYFHVRRESETKTTNKSESPARNLKPYFWLIILAASSTAEAASGAYPEAPI